MFILLLLDEIMLWVPIKSSWSVIMLHSPAIEFLPAESLHCWHTGVELFLNESHSVMLDSATPWTIQSMKFSRPEYWSGWPFPSPGDLLNPGIEPRSPTPQADSLPAEPAGKPKNMGVGSLSLLQWVFPIQESNWVLLLCRQILYLLCTLKIIVDSSISSCCSECLLQGFWQSIIWHIHVKHSCIL